MFASGYFKFAIVSLEGTLTSLSIRPPYSGFVLVLILKIEFVAAINYVLGGALQKR